MKREFTVRIYILRVSLAFCALSSVTVLAKEAGNGESRRLAYWKNEVNTLGSFDALPQEEKFEKLGKVLRSIKKPETYAFVRPDVEVFYAEIQSHLMGSPGHAKYFADQVERIRKTQEHLRRENQSNYDFWRERYLKGTLMHLPSPETIQVLGHYLNDERDTPPEISWLPENSFLAYRAISEIGLRNPPAKDVGFVNWREQLEKAQEWYAQVKAGALPFSFEGQDIEYRFRPDGTVESTPLAVIRESPSRPPPPISQPAFHPEEIAPVRPRDPFNQPKEYRWLWIAGSAVAVLAGVVWVRLRRE